MGESTEMNKFRIWLAVGTVVVYVFLAVTGNA